MLWFCSTFLLLANVVLAFVPHELQRRQTCNTATNRQCWTTSPAFDINTDWEASTPSTGVTRTVCIPLLYVARYDTNEPQYTFTITETNNWVGGDGGTKVRAMLVNGKFEPGDRQEAKLTWLSGQFPGPTITASKSIFSMDEGKC